MCATQDRPPVRCQDPRRRLVKKFVMPIFSGFQAFRQIFMSVMEKMRGNGKREEEKMGRKGLKAEGEAYCFYNLCTGNCSQVGMLHLKNSTGARLRLVLHLLSQITYRANACRESMLCLRPLQLVFLQIRFHSFLARRGEHDLVDELGGLEFSHDPSTMHGVCLIILVMIEVFYLAARRPHFAAAAVAWNVGEVRSDQIAITNRKSEQWWRSQ